MEETKILVVDRKFSKGENFMDTIFDPYKRKVHLVLFPVIGRGGLPSLEILRLLFKDTMNIKLFFVDAQTEDFSYYTLEGVGVEEFVEVLKNFGQNPQILSFSKEKPI
jgi:hypothetical protein